MRKLGMWRRLGVVLSVIWIIGAGIWQRTDDVARAHAMMQMTYETCAADASRKGHLDFSPCMAEADKEWPVWMEGSWANVIAFAFIPLAIAWLAAYASFKVTRWVLAGRHNSN